METKTLALTTLVVEASVWSVVVIQIIALALMSLPRLVGLGFLATVADAARTITVDLNAPWPTSALSPILETAEFFSEESTADFWRFAASLRGYANEFDAVDAGAYSEAAHEQQYPASPC